MTVGYLGAIRSITGVRQHDIDAPTVQELLEELLARYGSLWGDRVFDGRDLHPDVMVLVNGTNIRRTGGLSTPLGALDRVHILPMFEGG